MEGCRGDVETQSKRNERDNRKPMAVRVEGRREEIEGGRVKVAGERGR